MGTDRPRLPPAVPEWQARGLILLTGYRSQRAVMVLVLVSVVPVAGIR